MRASTLLVSVFWAVPAFAAVQHIPIKSNLQLASGEGQAQVARRRLEGPQRVQGRQLHG